MQKKGKNTFAGWRGPLKMLLGMVAMAALAGCALPKGGDAAWRDTNRPGFKVWGGWSSYTWDGACLNGFASGQGQLIGYGGSTKMLQYDGGMQQGLRHGQGVLWINNDEVYGGPETTSGMFVQGKFMDGTKSRERLVKTYAKGEETGYTERQVADGGTSGAAMFSVLAGVAQVASAAGGGNAANYQTMANVFQASADNYGNPAGAVNAGQQLAQQQSQSSSGSAKCDQFQPHSSYDQGIKRCNCEGKTPILTQSSTGRGFSCPTPNTANSWGCHYPADGSRPSCGMK